MATYDPNRQQYPPQQYPPQQYPPQQYPPQQYQPQNYQQPPYQQHPQPQEPYQQPQQYQQPEQYQPAPQQPYEVPQKDAAMDMPLIKPEEGEKFNYEQGQWRDLPFAVVFYLHLIALVAMAGLYGGEFIRAIKDGSSGGAVEEISTSRALSVVVAGVAGLIFSLVWLQMIKAYAASIVVISMVVTSVVWLIAAGLALVAGSVWGAVVPLIFIALQALFYCAVKKRIPFTAAIMKSSVESIQQNSGCVVATFFIALLQVVWVCFWAFTTGALNNRFYDNENNQPNGAVVFLMLVSLYWTGQVLKNVAHVTTAGVVASWWFLPDVKAPTAGALKRSLTTSFGSICLGSLIVAVLKAIRTLLQSAKNSARQSRNIGVLCAAACAECCLGIIENLVRFFNVYAYTQVAIYGKDFVSAAKDTWQLFKARGFEVLINSDLAGMVIGLGCLLGGLVSGLIAGGYLYAVETTPDTNWWLIGAIVGFLVGFLMTAVMMSVVESAVATTYVCWAEDPQALSVSRPGFYHNIAEAAKALHPDNTFF